VHAQADDAAGLLLALGDLPGDDGQQVALRDELREGEERLAVDPVARRGQSRGLERLRQGGRDAGGPRADPLGVREIGKAARLGERVVAARDESR
jgi:hypothetical protein